MLQGTIRDKNFVWDKSISSNLGDFLVKISNNAINELKIRHNFLNNSEDSGIDCIMTV